MPDWPSDAPLQLKVNAPVRDPGSYQSVDMAVAPVIVSAAGADGFTVSKTVNESLRSAPALLSLSTARTFHE